MAEQPLSDRPSIFHRTGPVRDTPKTPKKTKATFYLPPATIKHLKTVQWEEYEATGRQPDLSELVARAIDRLTVQDSTDVSQ